MMGRLSEMVVTGLELGLVKLKGPKAPDGFVSRQKTDNVGIEQAK